DRSGVLEREEHAEAGALVRAELQEVPAAPGDLAAVDDVGGMAHQGIGEGRLAGAVGAHDRVDLARPHLQVDALEDLALGRGDRGDAEAADDESVVGARVRGAVLLVAHDWVRAPSIDTRRCGTRSARVTPSSAPATASRTRIQSRLTVHEAVRSQASSCGSAPSVAQIIG